MEQPCLVALLLLLRIRRHIVGGVDVRLLREKFARKYPLVCCEARCGIVAHAGQCHRRIARLAHRNGQAVKHLPRQQCGRTVRRERASRELCRTSLHDEGIRIASERGIGTCEHV